MIVKQIVLKFKPRYTGSLAVEESESNYVAVDATDGYPYPTFPMFAMNFGTKENAEDYRLRWTDAYQQFDIYELTHDITEVSLD